MPITDNGLTTTFSQIQIGQDANAVLLRPDGSGGLLLRTAADSAAASFTMDDLTVDQVSAGSVSSGTGTVGAATVSANTKGDGRDFTTVLTLTDFVVGALAGAAAALGLGNKIFTFPAGAHVHYVTYMSVSCQCAGTGKSPDIGIGSVIAAGAVSVIGGTATFEDYITGQTATGTTATSTPTVKTSVATAGALTGISINEAADVKDVFLNAAATWAANNTGNLTSSGTITFHWTKLS